MRRVPVLYRVVALVAVTVVVLTLFTAVTLNAFAASSAVELRELRVDVAAEERRREQLLVEHAALSDPARLAREAEELGLAPPDRWHHLPVEDEESR